MTSSDAKQSIEEIRQYLAAMRQRVDRELGRLEARLDEIEQRISPKQLINPLR